MRAADDWEISFRFAGSPNRRGPVIGDIGGIGKRGWEYLWVSYPDDEDDDTGSSVKRPAAICVEQVYEYGDSSMLGIGT